jgi:nitrite reductase/ring-hydroxylating ferredoxin subunit
VSDDEPLRVHLRDEQTLAVRAGRWVRVDLGRFVELPIGRARSALVGVARGPGGEPVVTAWANACLHQPLPLDVTAEPVEIAPGVRAAPMDDDRVHLLCLSHGALYRTRDGYCVSGPCVGQSLVPIEVEQRGDALTLVLPIEE